ncbi:MAG: DUF2793 domain-containing protein [Henriciella sp.]|uniref:DUF2793 domain-containing protein n=1 Tax=Henriciella sp. TaxID=1968823 RepID=UPI003C710CA7
MDISAKLSLPYLLPNQASKHVTLNEGLRRLDALVQASILSAGLTEPPASPAEGDAYIIADGTPAGDWSGQTPGTLMAFQDGAWEAFAPAEGWRVFDAETSSLLVFEAGSWRTLAGPEARFDSLGINTDADASNRIAMKADRLLFSHDDVTPGTGDAAAVVNKAAPSNLSVMQFQTGFSGRAEIGLIGDDDFSIKTSSNGSAFNEALRLSSAGIMSVRGETTENLGEPGLSGMVVNGNLRMRSLAPMFILMESDEDNTFWNFVVGAGTVSLRRNNAFPGALQLRETQEVGLSRTPRLGMQLDSNGPIAPKSYTVAALPAASIGEGAIVYVSDETGGPTLAFSDGADWRRTSDNAVVA